MPNPRSVPDPEQHNERDIYEQAFEELMPVETESIVGGQITSEAINGLYESVVSQQILRPIRGGVTRSTFSPMFLQEEMSQKAPTMKKEEEQKLFLAKDKLDKESAKRRESSSKNMDERETEYRNLMTESEMTDPRIIIQSEVPLCVDSVGSDMVRRIAEQGHNDIYQSKGNYLIRCATCTRDLPAYLMYFCLERVFCAEHVPEVEICNVCLYPRTETKVVKTFDLKEVRVCPGCIRKNKCHNCGTRMNEDQVEQRECPECREHRSQDGPNRPWSRNMTYATDKTLGKILKTERQVSTELEFMLPSVPVYHQFASRIPKEVGVGSDGSLRGHGQGIEIQTPRLVGMGGEELIQKITEQALAHSARINETCGMHVHIDARDVLPKSRKDYPQALVQLWRAHIVFEDVILSLVPFKRRFNRYSRPMRSYFSLAEIEMVETMYGLERLWYRSSSQEGIRSAKEHHYHSSRYFGINLHPLFAGGHLEVRYHPGTLKANKVLEWANLHALIIDAAVKGAFNETLINEAQGTLTLGDKTNLLFEAIGLSKASKEYFFDRQTKFRDKKEGEESKEEEARPAMTMQERAIIRAEQQFRAPVSFGDDYSI